MTSADSNVFGIIARSLLHLPPRASHPISPRPQQVSCKLPRGFGKPPRLNRTEDEKQSRQHRPGPSRSAGITHDDGQSRLLPPHPQVLGPGGLPSPSAASPKNSRQSLSSPRCPSAQGSSSGRRGLSSPQNGLKRHIKYSAALNSGVFLCRLRPFRGELRRAVVLHGPGWIRLNYIIYRLFGIFCA